MNSGESVLYSLKKYLTGLVLLRTTYVILSTLWILGIFLPVLVDNKSIEQSIFPFINHSYSLVCHQEVEKSFFISGKKLLVCSRCTGIYSGAFLASIYLFFTLIKFQLNKFLLGIAPLPLLADVLFITSGLYEQNKTISSATGLFLGSVLFIYISDVLEKATNNN